MRTAILLAIALAGCLEQGDKTVKPGPVCVGAVVRDVRRPTPGDEGRLLVETGAKYYGGPVRSREEIAGPGRPKGRATKGKMYEVVCPPEAMDGLREGDVVDVLASYEDYMKAQRGQREGAQTRLVAVDIKVKKRK